MSLAFCLDDPESFQLEKTMEEGKVKKKNLVLDLKLCQRNECSEQYKKELYYFFSKFVAYRKTHIYVETELSIDPVFPYLEENIEYFSGNYSVLEQAKLQYTLNTA